MATVKAIHFSDLRLFSLGEIFRPAKSSVTTSEVSVGLITLRLRSDLIYHKIYGLRLLLFKTSDTISPVTGFSVRIRIYRMNWECSIYWITVSPAKVLSFSSRFRIRKMSDNIQRGFQDINLGLSEKPVVLPSALRQSATNINRFSIVVTPMNPKKQNLRVMITQLPRIWGLENSITGRIIGPGKIQFLFENEETMNMIIRRSPWSFGDWMLTVTRWYPNLSDESMKIIPFWIQIRGIPLEFLSRDTIDFIGDQIAPVFDVDFEESQTRVDFVRIQVLWNVDNPLQFKRIIQFVPDVNTVLERLDES